MIKSKKKLLISRAMAIVMLLSVFVPLGAAYAAERNYEDLLFCDVTVTQNGNPIDPDDGTLNNKDNISLHVEFGVPAYSDTLGDEETPGIDASRVFKNGDTFTIPISKSFDVVGAVSPFPLMYTIDEYNNVQIGTVTLATENGATVANVVIDIIEGNIENFEGGEGVDLESLWFDVTGLFDAELKFNNTDVSTENDEHFVTLINKKYKINIPDSTQEYTIEKSGEADLDTQTITWTATVTAKKGNDHLPLKGYIFSDDLSAVGSYGDSFSVKNAEGGDIGVPATTIDENTNPKLEDNILQYTFPEDAISPATITFKTKYRRF